MFNFSGLGTLMLSEYVFEEVERNILQLFHSTGKDRVDKTLHFSSSTSLEGGCVSARDGACDVEHHPIKSNLS